MTVLENVRSFIISIRPKRLCDECIARELLLSRRQHANHKTVLLSNSEENTFTRYKSICSLCGSARKVIWAK